MANRSTRESIGLLWSSLTPRERKWAAIAVVLITTALQFIAA